MKGIQIIIFILLFISCAKNEINETGQENEHVPFISAVDISRYPEISDFNPAFYDLEGNQNDFLTILKNNGVNTIRLRLWVNPSNEHSGFDEVKVFSQILKLNDFKVWIALHYSDTWADPGHQETPIEWQGLNFECFKR